MPTTDFRPSPRRGGRVFVALLAAVLSGVGWAARAAEAGDAAVVPTFAREEAPGFVPLADREVDAWREAAVAFNGRHAASGSLAVAGRHGYERLHEPWKGPRGRLLLEYRLDLRRRAGCRLTAVAVKETAGGDGVGLSAYAERGGTLAFLGRAVIPAEAGRWPLVLDLADFDGKMFSLFWVLDPNRATGKDTVGLVEIRALDGGGETLPAVRRAPRVFWEPGAVEPAAARENKSETAEPVETPLAFAPDAYPNFTPLARMPLADVRAALRPVPPRDGATGALAVPDAAAGYESLHVPWKTEGGRLVLPYAVDLREPGDPALSFRVAKKNKGGDGVGISVYAERGEGLDDFGRALVPSDAGVYRLRVGLERLGAWRGRLWIVVDANRTTHADAVSLDDVVLAGTGNADSAPTREKASRLREGDLLALELGRFRPDPAPVMTPHLDGRRLPGNVYSARDGRRPLLAAHVYFSPEARDRLPHLGDVFDYVTEDGKAAAQRLLELAGLPWVSIRHNPIPVNAYDETRLERIRATGRDLADARGKFAFLLGATTGSEPHFSPDFRYTGHKKEEVQELFTSPGGARDFGEWLAARYGDDTPGDDTNGDGFTFKKDFGFTAAAWGELGPAVPEGHPDYAYLHTLFKEHVIAGVVRAADAAYRTDPELPVTSRLLSPQYEAVFGQSLRQLAVPSLAAGVTNYTRRSNALDPAATQMRFVPSRVFESEKRFTDCFEIRPPFWQTKGSCYGVFGPFAGLEKMTFRLQGRFADPETFLEAELLRLRPGRPAETLLRHTVGAGADEAFSVALDPADDCRYEFRARSLTPERMNNRANLVWLAPTRHGAGGTRSLLDDFDGAETGYLLDSDPDTRVDIGRQINHYSPAITELRCGYIYQQGLKHGVRPVYNEFMPGNAVSNTPHNVWRSVFHELQFKPAGIVWFCYGGGAKTGSFTWMDCHYLATELAVLRGQLELLGVYDRIERPRGRVGVFLPSAAPSPLRGLRDAEQALGDALMDAGMDVWLADDFDKVAEYDNIVLLAGFLSGAADAWWRPWLARVPADKKAMVLFSGPHILTEPGRRASGDFRRALEGALPIHPAGDGEPFAAELAMRGVALSGKWQVAKAAEPAAGRDGTLMHADGKRPLAYEKGNLLVLAGIPERGLSALAHDFFGLEPRSTRDAGWLRLLNGDAVADHPGIYCADRGQALDVPPETPAFDLVRRRPVRGRLEGENVVFVPERDRPQLIDSGTARSRVVREDADGVDIHLSMPGYAFEGDARPELWLYAPRRPRVAVGDRSRDVEDMTDGFWRCALEHTGTYRVDWK